MGTIQPTSHSSFSASCLFFPASSKQGLREREKKQIKIKNENHKFKSPDRPCFIAYKVYDGFKVCMEKNWKKLEIMQK